MADKDGMQYQIVERAEAGDRYLHHFDTRADAEKAKGIYEQWARAQHLRYRYEILERERLMGFPVVTDPKAPENVIVHVSDPAPSASRAAEATAHYYLNRAAFQMQAQIALLTHMLEMVGFPSPSPQFDDLERLGIGILKERDREAYLAYLNAQSEFKRLSMQIGMEIEGDDRGEERRSRDSSYED